MAKFCKKCGSMLDENTGICKECNPTEALSEKGKEDISDSIIKEKQYKKKNLLFKIIALVMAAVIITGSAIVALVYFDVVDIPFISQLINRMTNSSAEEDVASEIVTAFENDDIEKINDIIFSKDKVVLDENYGVSFDDGIEDVNIKLKNGVFGKIFSYVEISYDGIENQQFVYTIKSPDMSGVFENAYELRTTDELVEHICNYAHKAKTIKYNVAVNYVNNQGRIIADYQTEGFIDAITGGLVSEYQKIYTQYINELLANEG